MAVLLTPPFLQFLDDDGEPLVGGKIFSYAAGTTTPKATFTTEAGDIENTNPIILDSSGRATIFIQGSYRFDVFDSNDVLIKSTDDVTSFTTLNESGDPFFQSFSGTGSQTVFTLSESLGDDSKDIMVYVDNGRPNYVLNGDFATDTEWTKGAGWTIGSGVATATGAISTALTQAADVTLVQNQAYVLTYTITRSAGGIIPSIGGRNGVERTASGTYSEIINADATQDIAFTGNAFTGTVDNVVIRLAGVTGYEIQNPNLYTLSGTSLTFNTAPKTGTNNIYVFAPTKLLGAASASAAAAEASAAAAASSAASASAAALSISSSSSVTIGTGTKTFTILADLAISAGQWLIISSDANPATNYMTGQITSYSGTTLQVNVTQSFGSGTLSDWSMKLSGVEGLIGPTGATGSVSATSAVVASTTAGASLQSSNNNDCISWGAGGAANSTLGGNMSGANTHKLVNMADPTSAQDYSTKAYVDTLVDGSLKNNITAETATTSGTTQSITGVSNAVEVTIHFFDVSLNANAAILIQAINAGGPVTTGYSSTNGGTSAGGTVVANTTNGFSIATSGTGNFVRGSITMHLVNASTNQWSIGGALASSAGVYYVIDGYVTLTTALAGIRLASSNGTDTFDSGSFSLTYKSEV